MAASELTEFARQVSELIKARKKPLTEMVMTGKIDTQLYARLCGQVQGLEFAEEDIKKVLTAWAKASADDDFFNRD